jgi:hypothetical protein
MGNPVTWDADAVVTALRSTIGDPAGATVPRWSDTELDNYYNRAQLQVVLDADITVKAMWDTTIVESQREYKLPDAFFKAERVQYIAPSDTDIRELRYMSRAAYRSWVLRDEDNEGEPTNYYLWRKTGDDPVSDGGSPSVAQPGSIFLHPTPNAAAAGANKLRIYGYKFPDSIANASGTKLVELEAPYVEAALMYAASLVKADDGEMGESNAFLVRFENQMDKVTAAQAREDRSRYSRAMPKGSRDRYSRAFPIRW